MVMAPLILHTGSPEFPSLKVAPKTTLKRAKTPVNYGLDPHDWRISDLLIFLDLECF